jgi:hypothetical protein
MANGKARPWLAAHEAAMGSPIRDIVVRLREALGAKLVAYMANVDTTRLVRAWADGATAPEPSSEGRLRVAAEALEILGASLDPVTIGTWFQGMNPLLGDVSPARFVRNMEGTHAKDVLVAARSMLIE